MSRPLLPLWPDVLPMGINIVAGVGSGKSRLLGRIFVPQNTYQKRAAIILDPIGETINNTIAKLIELPEDIQRQVWRHVRYIDMAGRDGVVMPFPLWYRTGTESLYQIAQRPLEIIRKADAWLMQAPVHGWNPTYYIGTYAGMLLYACGCQISELDHLLTFPEMWEERFAQAQQNMPDVTPAVAFFRNEYSKWGKDRRISRTESLRIKAATFTLDPESRAIFGAARPAIDVGTVIEKGLTVLVDFSGVTDFERRRFMLMWLVSYIMSYIKARGPGHDHPPLLLVIDEFSLLTNVQAAADTSFEQDLDELFSVFMRSHRLEVVTASQSLGQYSESTQRILMSLGTQILGRIADMESAEKIVQWFADLDMKRIKHEHPEFFGVDDWQNSVYLGRGHVHVPKRPAVINWRPEFYPFQENVYLEARKLRELKKFQFLIRPALEEGTVADRLYKVTIENFDKGIYPDMALVEKAKALLRKRSGIPVGQILAEIATRIPHAPTATSLPLPMKPQRAPRANSKPPQPQLPLADPDREDLW